MTRFIQCLLTALLILAVHANFDCERDTAQCQGGSSCQTVDGLCDCTGTAVARSGYDCSIIDADKGDALCTTNPCLNGGTCHKPSAAPGAVCLCTGSWMGATCNVVRYSVICDGVNKDMSLAITPDLTANAGAFAGSVYVFNSPSTCGLTDNGGVYEIDDLTFAASLNCPAASISGTQRTHQVLIQYGPAVFGRDEIISFTCEENSAVTVTKSGEITHFEDALTKIDKSQIPVSGDLSIDVKLGGASAFDGTVNLGATLTVEIDIVNSDYLGILIKSCSASNNDPSDAAAAGDLSEDFFANFCPATALKRSHPSIITASGTKKSFDFNAFYYAGTTTLWISCEVVVCSIAADCAAVSSCTAPGTGLGRRKRDVGTKEEMIKTMLQIGVPNGYNDVQRTVGDKEACFQTWQMTATVVSLAVGLVLVLFICVILTVKVIMYRKSRYVNDKC